MFCRSCGGQIPDDVRFCGICGAPLAGAEEAPSEADKSLSDATAETATGGEDETKSALPPDDTSLEQPTLKVTRDRTPVPPPESPPVATGGTPPPPPPTFVPPSAHPQQPAGYGPPGYGPPGYGPGGTPPRRSRLGLWIGVAAAVIIIAAGVTIPLVLLDRDKDDDTTDTTKASTTTTSAPSTTTTSSSSSTTTTTSSTTTTTMAPPGDSAGTWVFADAPEIPENTFSIKMTDEVLLTQANIGSGFALYAYFLDSGETMRLPTGGTATLDPDLDGSLVVWREAEYDWDTGEYSDARLYAYTLPNGPKVELAGGVGTYSYPQVAGSWVTWVENTPWDADPDTFVLKHIYGVQIGPDGERLGNPIELVSTATAEIWDEAYWTYSLSSTHLAWEVTAPIDIFDAGVYVMDLEDRQPLWIDEDSWVPSLGEHTLAYWTWEEGLKLRDLRTGSLEQIDLWGDYPSAGPTFVAYYRMIEAEYESTYEVVARGYETGYEQVLFETDMDPYFSAPLAVSERYVAVLVDDVVRLYEWESQ